MDKVQHAELNNKLNGLSEWQVEHAQDDEKSFKEIGARFDTIESDMSTLPKQEDIEKAVHKALYDFFKSSGNISYKAVLIVASVIVALGVISGGFKAILGWIGFGYIGK